MVYFGVLGIIYCLIGSIISNFIKCRNDDFSTYICLMQEEDSNKYFDNFSLFFKQLWKKERNTSANIGYIFIIVFKLFFNAINYFLSFTVLKFFNPEYLVCADSIFYFISKIICLIYYLVANLLKNDFLFDFLSQIFSILGTVIYLELIELNFCDLNHNLKKNIELRAKNDIYLVSMSDLQSIQGGYILE